nr:ArsR family transcriptional regulator [uncultured bacterium]
MLRYHFTVDDLARLRMATTLGPVAESVFALDLFGRKSGVALNGWRRHIREQLGEWSGEISRLAEVQGTQDLMWLLERGEPDPAHNDQARQQMTTALFEFCQIAVVPYWVRARTYLATERDMRGRIVITHGAERLLSTLHPGLEWTAPVLTIPSEHDRDIHLDGRGLLLAPSLFLYDKPCVAIEAERETGLPALAFSVPLIPTVLSSAPVSADAGDQALAALVGHTRAAALQALTDSCTTSELAQRLGISSAGASKHATILREAGLITTLRNRNTVLHTLTSLGAALLRRSSPRAPARQPAMAVD